MTLILYSQSSVSYFGLFSKDVQCAPEIRGQQLFHNKVLRLTVATVSFVMDIFPTVNYYPSPLNNELCQADVQKEL